MSIYHQVPARYHLRRTLRDADNLPAVPDAHAVANAIMALAGGTCTESARRYLDLECQRAQARLTELERQRAAAFDASVGIGFGPAVRS